jgi:hypothetical protein
MGPTMSVEKRFSATIDQVNSGDDMVAMVDLGIDGLYKKVRVRLKGVDTPNAYKATSDTDAGKLRSMVRKLVIGRKCEIVVHLQGKGGWVCTLYVLQDQDNVLDINELLSKQGYVYVQKELDQ